MPLHVGQALQQDDRIILHRSILCVVLKVVKLKMLITAAEAI